VVIGAVVLALAAGGISATLSLLSQAAREPVSSTAGVDYCFGESWPDNANGAGMARLPFVRWLKSRMGAHAVYALDYTPPPASGVARAPRRASRVDNRVRLGPGGDARADRPARSGGRGVCARVRTAIQRAAMRDLAGSVLLQGMVLLIGLGSLRALGLLGAGVRPAALGLGPAWLLGTVVVGLGLVLLLVLSVPFTLVVVAVAGVSAAGVAFAVAWHRGVPSERVVDVGVEGPSRLWLVRIAIATAGAYVGLGAYAFARAPIQADDARIWSLKGLALTYYDSLRPEIFLNPATSVSHHVYPLLQPVLEATLGRAMGQPELRLFHTELWLILIASIWTAAYLIWWRRERPVREQAGVMLLALVALTPAMVSNIWTGHADATGAVLLAAGAVALGLWIDGAADGHLWLAAILLGAAANTKDEDMIGAIVVLLAAGAVLAGRSHRVRLRLWLGAVGVCALLILPWRIWTAAHHLSDNVTPPLPRAVTPRFLLTHAPELRRVGMAILSHTVDEWGWAAAVFVTLCVVSFVTRTSRRLTAFYLISFAAIGVAMLWLYGTTPINLSLLIPRSMSRTVNVFMVLAAFASAHLVSTLTPRRRRASR
jgi:hypothetical protein